MPTNVNTTNLRINKLTEAQYDTAVQGGVIGPNELSVITDLDDAIQVSTMPTASADELGKVYQFIGTTGTYTHGYFYECVSDGQTPAAYSWVQTNVQPASSGLPSQTGNGGKVLTTDGTNASWGGDVTKGITFKRQSSSSGYVNVFYLPDTDPYSGANNGLSYQGLFSTAPEPYYSLTGNYFAYHFGKKQFYVQGNDTTLGSTGVLAWSKTYTKTINYGTDSSHNLTVPDIEGYIPAQCSTLPTLLVPEGIVVQYIGTTDANYTNGYFYKATNIIIPASYDSAVQTTGNSLSDITFDPDLAKQHYSSLPDSGTAVFSYNNGYWRYSGTGNPPGYTGLSYTGTPVNGDKITVTNYSITHNEASWTAIEVQASSGGLPTQTGNAGKFLTTDGTDASWATINALTNNTTTTDSLAILGTVTGVRGVAIGQGATASGNNSTAIGKGALSYVASLAVGHGAWGHSNGYFTAVGSNANAAGYGSIAIGTNAAAGAGGSIQLSARAITGHTNSDANTFKVGNNNGNYEIMSADGTIPTDRFTTTPVADGSYVPTVTISSGVATRSWTTPASAPVVPATMPTLTVNGWSSNTQTVNVTGVTASNIVFVSPAPASASDYASAGIVCNAQGSGTLTFTCTTTPTNAITVNVVILG